MNMVEKVSAALQASFKASVAEGAGISFEETGVSMPSAAVFERYARAAIEAMMEPTESMLGERERCAEIARSIEPHNEAEAHLIETIVRRIRGEG